MYKVFGPHTKNNNIDKSDSFNRFIACGGDVSGGHRLGVGDVFSLLCRSAPVPEAGAAGVVRRAAMCREPLGRASLPCRDDVRWPPRLWEGLSVRGNRWVKQARIPAKEVWVLGGQTRGDIGPCRGQGFANQPAGWWHGARESRKFPHLCFFPHFYSNLSMLRLDSARKEGCLPWKRLIFHWNKESRNNLLQLLCYTLALPSMGTTAPTTHHFLPLQET